MTDTTPETTPEDREQPDYPADASEAVAKGYAVYDTQLQRFVSGVYADKPSGTAAKRLAPNGHRVVRV
jgi:hypothetical protein